jgi:hypothetical protein
MMILIIFQKELNFFIEQTPLRQITNRGILPPMSYAILIPETRAGHKVGVPPDFFTLMLLNFHPNGHKRPILLQVG